MKATDVRHEPARAGDPPGRIVFSAPSYQEAAEAVDRLARLEFPVERTTIVARGLRLAEHVVGRRGVIEAIAEGGLTGAAIGGLIGVAFGLFTVVEAGLGLGLVIWGVVIGAILGAALALASYGAGGRRRFDSITSIESDQYDVVVGEPVAERAERLLRGEVERPG